MLPATIAFQGLKPIGGRYPQIVQCGCGVQITQFAPRHLDQISGEAFTRFIVEHCFGQGVFEALYHENSVSFIDTVVNCFVSNNDTFIHV